MARFNFGHPLRTRDIRRCPRTTLKYSCRRNTEQNCMYGDSYMPQSSA